MSLGQVKWSIGHGYNFSTNFIVLGGNDGKL